MKKQAGKSSYGKMVKKKISVTGKVASKAKKASKDKPTRKTKMM